jgi:SAM-dependent methyltransferase
VRLKWSRDWEYPWVMTRARLAPGVRALDCGAGNSPVPFVMASRGASVVALDRDAVVASRFRYAWMVLRDWLRGFVGLPLLLAGGASSHQSDRPAPGVASARPTSRRPLPARVWRCLRFNLAGRHRVAFSRIWKPDFWGPVSPRLLDRFRVEYVHADFTRLPFPDASFDLVTCVSVMEHMPPDTRTRGVREMARVLKPGGQLLLTYDLQERDLTRELVDASALDPVELARLEGVTTPTGRRRPDAIGLHLGKPAGAAIGVGAAGRPA